MTLTNFSETQQPSITPELQRLRIKAKNEIGEKEDLIPQKVDEVRQLLIADCTVTLPPKKFDHFLLRCLRARKYDVHRAAKTYKKLCHLHHKLQEVTNYMLPTKYNDLLRDRFASLLKTRDALGRQILFIQVQGWNGYNNTLNEALAALFMYLDQATEYIDTQYNGLIVLVDFKGFGFSHAKQVTPSVVQGVVSAVQDAYPARFKEIHFYNHPSLFNMIFAVAKPFLKDKIRKRIFFHGRDLSSVHRSINPTYLPEYLGGKLPDNEFHDQDAFHHLLQKDEYFQEMKQYFVLRDHNSSSSHQTENLDQA